ncbi:SDR family NAD(P)-dependent oxidoreductase [Streptomyces sp. NPDC006012]|uniref:SDR family NAD(P)-dependent oxidoreductase n=1 Tax=Streptomyces sp. NPDC006012 TaxID=3364739 RepID=UPI0036B1D45F
MDMQLAGKRALVTGSSAGLGRSIAEALAREGVTVVVHGRDEERTQGTADRILAEGGQADVAVGDLSTAEGAEAVAAKALSGGTVDILVNNAGAYDQVGWMDATPEIWAKTYQVNVVSGVRMVRSLVPGMRQSGWGRVIQIGGGLAVQPMSAQPHYNASLAARHNLAVSLAREVKGSGITSNTVAPGAILTDTVRDLLWQIAPAHGWGETWEEIERAAAESWVPNDTNRFGRPEEIADAVVYLASPRADYISGATLRVDGGTIRSVN